MSRDLPPRSVLIREIEDGLAAYEELLEAVFGMGKLRVWGDVHEMALERLKYLNELEQKVKNES
jgi:gamma-glutamylcyclotransferase (GGCT)/AIG2-like uncharacterized protein YtfP